MGIVSALSSLLSTGAGALAGSQVSTRLACHLNPRPMPHQFAPALDHPMRMRYRNVGETLGILGFVEGMTVLDLGCGTGLFTLEMGRMVGETGAVHAVDIQQPLLDETSRRAQAEGLGQRVRLHHSGAYNLPLPDDSCDLAVLIATLSEIPDRHAALLELRRVLKPGARLAISEEVLDPAYVPARITRDWAETVGFVTIGKTGSFFCYTLVFSNEKQTSPTILVP